MSTRVTKTCVACGLEKPLSAYLQISGPQGSSYGNICSTCRGSGMGKKVVIPVAEDEHSSSSAGLKIDAKKKIQQDLEKKQNIQRTRDLEHKESKKREGHSEDKLDRIQTIEKSEKDHREGYIEVKKKDSFLNYKHKQSSTASTRSPQEKKSFLDHSNRVETQKQENIQLEEKAKNIDVSDAPHGSEAKYQSEAFLRFIDERMAGTAIHAVRRQFNPKKPVTESKQPAATEEKDQLIDFINDNWKPGSRR